MSSGTCLFLGKSPQNNQNEERGKGPQNKGRGRNQSGNKDTPTKKKTLNSRLGVKKNVKNAAKKGVNKK